MGFWDKSLRIFKCLCDHGKQSVRRLAHQTGLAKSSVHRLRQAMERRSGSPEAGLWETEAGRQWLTRLVVATLYTFGLKRGVGMDTLSEFFVRLRLQHQVGCSPTALRGVMQTLERTIVETATTWEQEGTTAGEVREIIGAVDETFLEHMMLVLHGSAQRILAPGRGGSGSHLCHLESRGGRAAQGPGSRRCFIWSVIAPKP